MVLYIGYTTRASTGTLARAVFRAGGSSQVFHCSLEPERERVCERGYEADQLLRGLKLARLTGVDRLS